MESIAKLMAELPADYEECCIKAGAIERRRGVANPADLMMLGIFHLHNGCSLLEISEIARISKLGRMSDVAFMNRFEKCGDWFKVINGKLASNGIIDYQKPAWMSEKTVIGVDASDVSEKGRSGRLYRLHFALDIFTMGSLQHLITTTDTGESICHFTLKPEDLVIADRAYSTIKGIVHCNKAGAGYILRLRKSSFTVKDNAGDKIDLQHLFSGLKEDEYADITAFATNSDGASVPVRVCAKRKTPEAIVQTQKKLRRKESRKQLLISDEAKTFNEYIVVVTNVSETVSAEEVLEAYRYRWQIEIYFKRLKSIMDFGEMPKRREKSVIAWLNGKLMIALLLEIILAKASFPLQNYRRQKHLSRNKINVPMAVY
jgi:hypothetical protein